MTLRALREDALASTAHGTELRLSLPWIRSLPLSSVLAAKVRIDGADHGVRLPDSDPEAWWHIQDRLVLASDTDIACGEREVWVELSLEIPYLPMSEAPLTVRIAEQARLTVGIELPHAGRDIR